MGRQFVLWSVFANAAPQKTALAGPVWLSAAGIVPGGPGPAAGLREGALLLPVNVGKRATVVVIVPDALHYVISAKQVPMPAGLHELGHADQLQWGQLTAWLAENQQAELSEYDPAVHGPDQRCGRTKARLRSGDRIVLCPGCGMIFSERAYALGRPCEYCRHDPAQAEWVPPPPRSNGQGLAELFGLLGVDRGHRQYQAEA